MWEGGNEDAGENFSTFNYDQEVSHQKVEVCSSVSLGNPALKVGYCVERFLLTVIVHIQLPLQLLICIIGSLMKLSAWEKTQKVL